IWSQPIQGTLQYRFCHKLKLLKTMFKGITKNIGEVTIRAKEAKEAKEALERCQRMLDDNPSDPAMNQEEQRLLANYIQAAKIEEGFYKQKSRVQWLSEEDKNTSFFHKTMANKRNKKKDFGSYES
ncbi:unnamed protein product, partial [Ilex paraguariensis]